MNRIVYTAIFAAVVSLASANAMADSVTKTETTKPVHHKKHHARMMHNYALSAKEIQVLQQSLRDSGFYKGTVTGNWSPMTENALASYQSANGLPVTGTLTDATITKLGLHNIAKEKVSTDVTPGKTPRHAPRHKIKAANKAVVLNGEKTVTKDKH
ncbi:MAG: hypothetical protein JWO78_247 [Micavibrio sp.]|nr:hypothetical protein [Micavibrio sp.]